VASFSCPACRSRPAQADHLRPERWLAPVFSRMAISRLCPGLRGDENYDLFVYELATGSRNLAPDTPGGRSTLPSRGRPIARELRLSPTAKADSPLVIHGRRDARVPGDTSRLFDMRADWSPDGRYLAVTALAQAQRHGCFSSARRRQVKSGRWTAGPRMPPGRWSPDGRRLALRPTRPA
jgi:hypothetical protein